MKRILTISIFLLCLIAAGIIRNYAVKDLAAVNIGTKPNMEHQINNDHPVPVLMYHSIAQENGNELRVPKENFEAQMKYLRENNYSTLTLDQLYNYLNNNKPIPEKSVVITFDDGYADNYENALPILKKYSFHAAIFVITSTVDKNDKCLNSSQLKEMQENGIDIESHTVDHVELDKLSYDRQLYQLRESKLKLEQILNKKVYYLVYPVGKWNKETIEAAAEAGYSMAFTTKNSKTSVDNGLYTLNRIRINASCTMKQFGNLIK